MSNRCRYDWTQEEALALYHQPFADLMHQAQTIHRQHFDANAIQKATLFNIKTGACPEDCRYCAQSRYNKATLQKETLTSIETTLAKAKEAQENGATRFCLGAAWRSPNDRQLEVVKSMIKEIKKLGLETCVTLGMLREDQANELKACGLDFYNHNLDTSPEYYPNVITTRTYEDRLSTLSAVRKAGLKVCCGGILGLGESIRDRLELLIQLSQLQPHPESVPINHLVKIKGTPLENAESVPDIDFVRIIAVARIMMPTSFLRLTAGRESMSDTLQALCFLAGANSIFVGEKLLTVANTTLDKDTRMMNSLGLHPTV